MASNALLAKLDIQLNITVSCVAPKLGESIIVRENMYQYHGCYWTCTLTNKQPQLELSLVSATNPAIESNFFRPKNIRSLRIVSRNGTLLHNSSTNDVVDEVPLKATFDMASVTIDQRLDFDIVLSTRADLYQISKPEDVADAKDTNEAKDSKATTPIPKRNESVVPKFKGILSTLLKDISTMNMAFIFGLNGSARDVALWAHQSILERQPSMAALINKLKHIESDISGLEAPFRFKTIHIIEYSLETYCALVRYLYTSEIKLEVNLDDFAIGCPPSKPFSPHCKSRPVVKGLFPSKDTASLNAESDLSDELSAFGLVELFKLHESDESEESVAPKRATTWSDLFQITDCYQVTELREYCLGKILDTLDASTALGMLFDFAYRYPDLKKIVLQVVADNMPSLYAASQDPFAAFEDHRERQVLMAEAFQLVFNAKAQI